MKLSANELYQEDLRSVAELPLNWEDLSGKTILIAGVSGMVGRFLVDTLLYKNRVEGLGCQIYALGRNREKLMDRFRLCLGDENFSPVCCDITQSIKLASETIDYVLHLASNSHPILYAVDPIGTITANVIGTYRLLELSVKKKAKRFLFASSVEIYGENRGDTDAFDENYCGYIDSNTLRAGYPESKRCGEALCQAYRKQKSVDFVVARLSRVFGPTMQMSDSKAISQFIKRAVEHKDIILKSEGSQLYSYSYVADAVSGIFYCLLKGKCGEAYNIAAEHDSMTLKELSERLAGYAGVKVGFEFPNAIEKEGYTKATKAVLNGKKICELGWKPLYSLETALPRTLKILEDVNF